MWAVDPVAMVSAVPMLKQKYILLAAILAGSLFDSSLITAVADEESKSESQAADPSASAVSPAPEPVSTPATKPPEALKPDDAIQKARIEVNRKRFPDAKLILKQSIKANPKSIALYTELYDTCVKSNDWSDASGSLEKIMEIAPDKEKDLYVDYAFTLFKLQRYEKAKAAYDKALGFGKNKDEIYKTLIKIALAAKPPDEPTAEAQYREYFKVKPNDGDMHWEYANFLYRAKKTKESLVEYKLASENRPKDSYGHERLAYLLLVEKDYDGSIAAYKKAIGSRGPDPHLREALKYALQQQKRAAGPAAAPAK